MDSSNQHKITIDITQGNSELVSLKKGGGVKGLMVPKYKGQYSFLVHILYVPVVFVASINCMGTINFHIVAVG